MWYNFSSLKVVIMSWQNGPSSHLRRVFFLSPFFVASSLYQTWFGYFALSAAFEVQGFLPFLSFFLPVFLYPWCPQYNQNIKIVLQPCGKNVFWKACTERCLISAHADGGPGSHVCTSLTLHSAPHQHRERESRKKPLIVNINNQVKQAGAELCQAQAQLGYLMTLS